jgi:glucose/arabinose dehydrogenase
VKHPALIRTALTFACVAAAASLGDARARAVAALPSPLAGFDIAVVARVPEPRQLAAAPNGDLLVGTAGSDVYIVANSEDTARPARVFAHLDDDEAAGVALDGATLFVGTEHGVWRVPYRTGVRGVNDDVRRIASVRTAGGDDHVTTSLAIAGGALFAAVGSSCNVCVESDPTRATVQQMTSNGGAMHAKAVHIRNAIALATNAATGSLWAGVAGQDELQHGHPYEIFDPVTLHRGTPDYGWPTCYENHRPVRPGIDCSNAVAARVVFPAYATPTGAAFYPAHPVGRYAFPQAYRGGAFVTFHGSWHTPPVPPRVAFVAMRGDQPQHPVDWSDPNIQWSSFAGGFQVRGFGRIGRPSGVAVGAQGSLFVADDLAGVIYRIRPAHDRVAINAGRAKT